MSVTIDFYLSRAAESAQAARDATLENVRDRSLRAEAAWLTMANRLMHTEEKKKRDALDKAMRANEAATAGDVPWPIAPTPHRAREDG